MGIENELPLPVLLLGQYLTKKKEKVEALQLCETEHRSQDSELAGQASASLESSKFSVVLETLL